MRTGAVSFALLLVGSPLAANAQFVKDPPWNPEHIDHLPFEIRSAVLAKCPTKPDAGHYFATYYHDEIHLHFEYFHCASASFCNASGCLHQTYSARSGHYRLVKSSYASD
jgi:hypothetical protein